MLLALPYPVGEVTVAPLFDDRLFVAFPGEAAPPGDGAVRADEIDAERLLLLEDGHCLKDHALAACGRPEAREQAAMMGTSLHTVVQMVDGGLGITVLPGMAIAAGILDGTRVEARPLEADTPARRIALIWRKASPREKDFRLLAEVLAGAG